MSVKKIKGYKIFIEQKLGKGAYGTVLDDEIIGLSGWIGGLNE